MSNTIENGPYASGPARKDSCVIVKIDKRELNRLRAIETATRPFANEVMRTGTKSAIARLLDKAARAQEGRS